MTYSGMTQTLSQHTMPTYYTNKQQRNNQRNMTGLQ